MGACGWTIERLLPVLLAAYIVGTSFGIFQIAYLGTIVVSDGIFFAAPSAALGYALLAVWSILAVALVASLATGWWYSFFHAPFWMPHGPLSHALFFRPFLPVAFISSRVQRWLTFAAREGRPPPPPPKRWQQARKETIARLPIGAFEILEAERPNHCVREWRHDCRNADDARRDRMYHSWYPHAFERNIVDSCLPVYDHWCHWLGVAVYLHTIKPYLLAIIYLIVYSAYVSVVFFWASTQERLKELRLEFMPFAAASFVVVWFLSIGVLIPRLVDLVYRNQTDYEKRHPETFTMALPLQNGAYLLTKPPMNPWNQGSWSRNWRHVMGANVYEWLVPFWKPQRVRDYDNPDKTNFDEQFGDEFLMWTRTSKVAREIAKASRIPMTQQPGPVHLQSRRELALSSSGTDIPLRDIRSRHPQLDV